MSVLDDWALDTHRGVQTMNLLAFRGTPFFFLIDAWANRWIVMDQTEAESAGFRWSLDGRGNLKGREPIGRKFTFRYTAVSPIRYSQAFDKIRAAQLDGDTWLANLTFPADLETDLSLSEIIKSARAPFRLHIPGELVIFSPERFVRIDHFGSISSFPMKGTISAELPNAETTILNDSKEAAEHVTIVDLIRNDIGMVADRVRVPRYRFITEVAGNRQRLLQVSSEVRGELGRFWKNRIGDVLRRILPAGSVTGAPKLKTAEIIRDAESYERGWYTGIFGCFDGKELDSAVSIRFIERKSDGSLIYKSGGGITINSVKDSEYQELKDKIYVPTG